jgi:hypothetical protein
VARALRLGPVDVLGHSRGGFLAGFHGASPSSTNPHVSVVPMPFIHLEPAWDAIDEVVAVVEPFLLLR